MKCTEKEQETCEVEKMTCNGCYYSTDSSIKELELWIAKDDEQWKNWQEVLKYINSLQEEIASIKSEEIKFATLAMDKDIITTKQNKIIDLMAEQLTTPLHSKKDVIEHYKREVEKKI